MEISHKEIERRKKISQKMKGRKKSIVHCKNISLGKKGVPVPGERRKRISQTLTGRKMPYVSEANRKRIWSEETKLKRREVMKRIWQQVDFQKKMMFVVSNPSQETRNKNSEAHKGNKAYNYISDRTKLKRSEKKHLDSRYIEWMKSVKNRDKWKCKLFGEISYECSGPVEAHHIFNWSEFPKLRYKLNNGITLCHAHHPRGRAKEKRMAPLLQILLEEDNH